MVFNGREVERDQFESLIRWRLASWCKAKWPEIPDSLLDFARCLEMVKVPVKLSIPRPGLSWSPSKENILKFNTDGSTLEQPSLARVGGILRDSRSNSKIIERQNSIR